MFFRTSEPTLSVGIGSSISVSILGIRGERMPLGSSAPTEIPIRREEPSMRMDAGEQLPRDVSKKNQPMSLSSDASTICIRNRRCRHRLPERSWWPTRTASICGDA